MLLLGGKSLAIAEIVNNCLLSSLILNTLPIGFSFPKYFFAALSLITALWLPEKAEDGCALINGKSNSLKKFLSTYAAFCPTSLNLPVPVLINGSYILLIRHTSFTSGKLVLRSSARITGVTN